MKNLKFAFLFVLLATIGCGRTSPDDAIRASNKSNIQRLSNCYAMYQFNNGWQGPKDEASFKEYLNGVRPKILERMGITDVDAIFVSERDGQPFKVRYAVNGTARGTSEAVVFESEGSGGKKMVGFLNMTQREVDQAEYDELFGSNDG